MPLPGEEIVGPPTRPEVMRARADGLHKAYQHFCYCGVLHVGIGRRPLSQQQKAIFNLARVGWKPKQIEKRMNIPLASVYDGLHKIKHNGWQI